MSTLDFSPLFRTAIGFDRLARLVDTANAASDTQAYPPYNIEKTGDDSYRLTMAVAGFGPDDIEMVVRENTLVIAGRVRSESKPTEVLYRGIGRPRVRAPLHARRPYRGRGRRPRQRPAACRPEARGARGAKAPPNLDRHGSCFGPGHRGLGQQRPKQR